MGRDSRLLRAPALRLALGRNRPRRDQLASPYPEGPESRLRGSRRRSALNAAPSLISIRMEVSHNG